MVSQIGSPGIFGSITNIRPSEILPGAPLDVYVDFFAETTIYSPLWNVKVVVELDDGTKGEKLFSVIQPYPYKSVTEKDAKVSLGISMPDRILNGTVHLYGKGGLA